MDSYFLKLEKPRPGLPRADDEVVPKGFVQKLLYIKFDYHEGHICILYVAYIALVVIRFMNRNIYLSFEQCNNNVKARGGNRSNAILYYLFSDAMSSMI